MKKFFISSMIIFIAPICFAAQLLPGARIYHVLNFKKKATNDYPTFSGTIINLNTSKQLTATNYIKVANHFPKSIVASSTASYSVTPAIPVGGYEQWTYPINYSHGDGDACYLQFGWNPSIQSPDIGYFCDGFYPQSGTNIAIN
jgi:hypothetical protein